jgi:hypothetical protein
MLTTILIIILILILLGAFPAWPHSRGWGYGPSGVVGLIKPGNDKRGEVSRTPRR